MVGMVQEAHHQAPMYFTDVGLPQVTHGSAWQPRPWAPAAATAIDVSYEPCLVHVRSMCSATLLVLSRIMLVPTGRALPHAVSRRRGAHVALRRRLSNPISSHDHCR